MYFANEDGVWAHNPNGFQKATSRLSATLEPSVGSECCWRFYGVGTGGGLERLREFLDVEGPREGALLSVLVGRGLLPIEPLLEQAAAETATNRSADTGNTLTRGDEMHDE